MLQKLLILTFILGSSMSQTTYNLMCSFEIANDLCTCNFLIFNPNGFNNFTIGGDTTGNCTFTNAKQVIGTGLTPNVPSIICESFPQLETLQLNQVSLTNLADNPFRQCGKLKNLSLRNNSITGFIAYTLANTDLEFLDLSFNLLTTLDQYAFNSLNKLQGLNLEGNFGIVLPGAIFRDLTSLIALNLKSCGLEAIEPSWFETLRNVRNLLLSKNGITSIPETAFVNLFNLNRLEISHCSISSINADSFVNNRNMRVLLLNNNNLQTLYVNLFRYQDNLETLNLSYNNLATIPSGAFQQLVSMQNINLASNNISNVQTSWFSSMNRLNTVDLSRNNLALIPWDTFTATDVLQNLVIERNRITKLDARSFGSLNGLVNLRAENNALTEIDHHFMNQSRVKRFVRLAGNGCTELDTDNFLQSRAAYMEDLKPCFDAFDRNPIELETYNSTLFDWHNIRPDDDWQAIEVSVRAFENARIGLIDSLNEDSPHIEIRLGERDNHESHIYERGTRVFLDRTHYPVSDTQMRTFLIGWRFGIIMVYRANERFPFMAHSIKEPFPVNFFGLRTEINQYNSNRKALWNVLRIQGNRGIQNNQFLPMKMAYDQIEANLKLGLPIDLNELLRKK